MAIIANPAAVMTSSANCRKCYIVVSLSNKIDKLVAIVVPMSLCTPMSIMDFVHVAPSLFDTAAFDGAGNQSAI